MEYKNTTAQEIIIEAGKKLGLDPRIVMEIATTEFVDICPYTGKELPQPTCGNKHK